MENLKDTIIEKLNKLLNSDKLIIKQLHPIDSFSDPTIINLFNFGLFKINDMHYSCLHCWNTFYDMLYSNTSIFNIHNKISFCKGDSLEEIIIKMDLMGI
jgi:hypothetical protein